GPGLRDRLHVGQALGGLDQDVNADPVGLPSIALFDLVQQRCHELDVARRANLGYEDGVEHVAAGLDHLDNVAVTPVRVESVDPDAHRTCAPVVRAQGIDHADAS